MRPSELLRRKHAQVLEIIAGYPVRNPKIFGSVARGDDTEQSDLDIVVERGGLRSYTQLFELEDALSKLLGIKVDLHTQAELGARFSAGIVQDLKNI